MFYFVASFLTNLKTNQLYCKKQNGKKKTFVFTIYFWNDESILYSVSVISSLKKGHTIYCLHSRHLMELYFVTSSNIIQLVIVNSSLFYFHIIIQNWKFIFFKYWKKLCENDSVKIISALLIFNTNFCNWDNVCMHSFDMNIIDTNINKISYRTYNFNQQHFEICVIVNADNLKHGVSTTYSRKNDDVE